MVAALRSSHVEIPLIVGGEAIRPSCTSGVAMSRSSRYHISRAEVMGLLSTLKDETSELGPLYSVRFGKRMGFKCPSGPSRVSVRWVIVACRFRKAGKRAAVSCCTVYRNFARLGK
jgi:hypothetical protein